MPKRREHVTAVQLAIKAGDLVMLTDDLGIPHQTIARSEPWQIGGAWIVKVQACGNGGKHGHGTAGVGGYLLSRIQPVEPRTPELVPSERGAAD